MAVQLTLADGFFNRKRGRPPKNRFVQVYKNLQLPVAIFTSFKLERQNRENVSTSPVEIDGISGGNRINLLSHTQVHDSLRSENNFCFTNIDENGRESFKETMEMELRPKSTIRSTGIYYPDSAPSVDTTNTLLNNSNKISPEQVYQKNAMPEELTHVESLSSNFKFAYSYLQVLQLIHALYYYRTLYKPKAIESINSNFAEGGTPPSKANEDCILRSCRLRHRHSSSHCFRNDCRLSTKQRLDCILGTDFKQFLPHEKCGPGSCTAANVRKKQSSHFHCLRCLFTCCEACKIAPHRRWHKTLELLQDNGFRKVTIGEECSTKQCKYNGKKTHYSCVVCAICVLSKSQILRHKHVSNKNV